MDSTENNNSSIITEDLIEIKNLLDSSEVLIRNELNFYKYYMSILKNQNKIELKCFENDGALFKLILTVYATYEFSVKRMLIYTLEVIDKEQVKVKDLKIKLRALYFKEHMEDLRLKITSSNPESKNFISDKLVKIYNHFEEVEKFAAIEAMVDTKSNLKYDVLCEIISYFEFDENIFRNYKKYIESLVHYRNNVAHGNIGFTDNLPPRLMPIRSQNSEELCENIIKLLKDLFSCIESYITEKKYRL
ncbi:MAE_28990/MAE_18760 family HEPN-like nuclease [Paenibacillus sp. TAF43_2]|uniref:MAE_28990/MAE_18760 family HEPN-like nuclease n=1 Tax=Paenibacillus sp. TAF43_2 TaxID=3233069 RepID=UPI003F97B9B3